MDKKQKAGHPSADGPRPYDLRAVRRSETAATARLPSDNRQSAIANELIPATPIQTIGAGDRG
jgi:hypothetical protein